MPGYLVILAAALGLATGAFAEGRDSVTARLGADGAPLVIAHRSAEMGGTPENSLAWIGHAIERGVDMVHLNPQRTADGRYVLMHDPTLSRTTDVEQVFPEGPPGGPSR